MKTLLIISILALASCSKEWECCVDTTTTNTNPSTEQLNGTTTHCIDYTGTTEEKESFESQGTKTTTGSDIYGYPYTIDQITHCQPK